MALRPTRAQLALLLALSLPACADLRAARQGCPLADAVATYPVTIDFNMTDGDCAGFRLFTEPGSPVPVGCVELEPTTAYDCGYAFALACETPQGAVDVVGYLGVESVRVGPYGEAEATWGNGCVATYEVDGWQTKPGERPATVSP